jgi:hypothetical protein
MHAETFFEVLYFFEVPVIEVGGDDEFIGDVAEFFVVIVID